MKKIITGLKTTTTRNWKTVVKLLELVNGKIDK